MEVEDRGPGVEQQAVGSLFTPYYTTRAAGTGLGLAIVRQIGTAHGWRVGYRPRCGGGSIFEIDGIDGSVGLCDPGNSRRPRSHRP